MTRPHITFEIWRREAVHAWEYYYIRNYPGHRDSPPQRLGQFFYNNLSEVMHPSPIFWTAMADANVDPFFVDERLPEFMEWLRRHWEDME